MAEKHTIKLTLHDLTVIRMNVEAFIARKVYSYIYANTQNGSDSVPTLRATMDHMEATYASEYKVHKCLKDRMLTASFIHTEDLAMNFYYKCVEKMRWQESHPPTPVELVMTARPRVQWRPAVPETDMEIPF